MAFDAGARTKGLKLKGKTKRGKKKKKHNSLHKRGK